MSWTKLDDGLIDHEKVFTAGRRMNNDDQIRKGANGAAIAIGFYAVAIMWSNKHLTDGFIPRDVVATLPHVQEPIAVADALTRAGLLERVKRGSKPGFLIHDFADYNFSAAAVKQKRRADRERKKGNGHG